MGTINPFAGAAVLGTSAAGNAYNEMINAGYSKNQARIYAVLVGGSEAGLSYLLGGITALLSDGKSTVDKAKVEAAVARMEKIMNSESAKPGEKAEARKPTEDIEKP